VARPIGHTALNDSGAQQQRHIGQATLGQAALTRPAAGPQPAHKGGGSRQEEKRNEGEKRRSTSDARRHSTALTSVARGKGCRLFVAAHSTSNGTHRRPRRQRIKAVAAVLHGSAAEAPRGGGTRSPQRQEAAPSGAGGDCSWEGIFND